MSESQEQEIRRRIEARLRHPHLVDTKDLRVRVDGNHVTLEGTCEQWEQARMLDYMVSQVPGVETLTTRVRIRVTGGRSAELVEADAPSEQFHHNVPPA